MAGFKIISGDGFTIEAQKFYSNPKVNESIWLLTLREGKFPSDNWLMNWVAGGTGVKATGEIIPSTHPTWRYLILK